MKLTLKEEEFEFDFPNAKTLYKFDEKDPLSPTFHGAPMQAVDVMAEFPNFQLWIEIKEFQPSDIEAMKKERNVLWASSLVESAYSNTMLIRTKQEIMMLIQFYF